MKTEKAPEFVLGRPGFRFSNWGVAGREELNNWKRWFDEKGIVSEVRTDPTTGETALFRQGVEARTEPRKEKATA